MEACNLAGLRSQLHSSIAQVDQTLCQADDGVVCGCHEVHCLPRTGIGVRLKVVQPHLCTVHAVRCPGATNRGMILHAPPQRGAANIATRRYRTQQQALKIESLPQRCTVAINERCRLLQFHCGKPLCTFAQLPACWQSVVICQLWSRHSLHAMHNFRNCHIRCATGSFCFP